MEDGPATDHLETYLLGKGLVGCMEEAPAGIWDIRRAIQVL